MPAFDTDQHIQHVVQFGFTVCLRGEDAVVYKPELVLFRIIIYAVNNTITFDNAIYIAWLLTTYQANLVGVFFMEHGIIKD